MTKRIPTGTATRRIGGLNAAARLIATHQPGAPAVIVCTPAIASGVRIADDTIVLPNETTAIAKAARRGTAGAAAGRIRMADETGILANQTTAITEAMGANGLPASMRVADRPSVVVD